MSERQNRPTWMGKSVPAKYSPRDIFVFILGMHRSGTSCLTGSLEQCDLFLGEVSRSTKCNAKGTHEPIATRRPHFRILAANGGFWRHPPAQIIVAPRQRQTLEKIAAQLARNAPCGLKDPRLLLFLDTWLDVVGSLDVSPVLVGTFRHPIAVAQSLAKRNKMSEHEATTLWLLHNIQLVRLHQMYNLPIIEYDLSDVQAYCRTVSDLAAALGLEPDIDRLLEFVSASLEHNRARQSPVPTMCQEIYAYLQQHRYQPGAYSRDDLQLQIQKGQQRAVQPLKILQQATQTLESERQRYARRRLWDTFRWRLHLFVRPFRRVIGRPNW